MQTTVLQIHPDDNVLVALQDLEKDYTIQFGEEQITLPFSVPQKHKFTIKVIPEGETIKMYGVAVGKATQRIPKGGVITTDNTHHQTEDYTTTIQPYTWEPPDTSRFEGKTFMGYHRTDGKVGTANIWLVIPLVFCENRNIETLKEILLEKLGYAPQRNLGINLEALIRKKQQQASTEEILATDILVEESSSTSSRIFENIDGIKFLTHEGGCGGTRQDAEVLCKLLAGYITHPNVAGATILSLGCQNAQIPMLQGYIEAFSPQFDKPLFYLEQQQSRSEPAFIAEAVKKTFVGLMQANTVHRKPAPLSKLSLGLKCGGSDGFSGISANPALGYAADLLVALGGTALLAEFPELNGVEQALIHRCLHQEDADKFARLMKTYAAKAEAVGSSFAFNPSPGNIKDGLITDAMKSAGAAKKGGTSPIVRVLDYAEQTDITGLHLLCTPGNDVEATTGLAGSGAQVIVFTTGLGTPTGNPIAQVLKFSTNQSLYKRMRDILDSSAGTIITGEDTIASKGEELLELIIETASGHYLPKAVQLGQDDFIPWKRDISL
ncbi:MAG: UxaA family hydrolase [Thermonemataceae bacterium]